MTKPDWCPTDVWETVRAAEMATFVARSTGRKVSDKEMLARAILAERERALEEAAQCAYNMNALCCGNAVFLVAGAIRALKETP